MVGNEPVGGQRYMGVQARELFVLRAIHYSQVVALVTTEVSAEDQPVRVVREVTTAIPQTAELSEQVVFRQLPIREQMVVLVIMLRRCRDVALLPDRYREGNG